MSKPLDTSTTGIYSNFSRNLSVCQSNKKSRLIKSYRAKECEIDEIMTILAESIPKTVLKIVKIESLVQERCTRYLPCYPAIKLSLSVRFSKKN